MLKGQIGSRVGFMHSRTSFVPSATLLSHWRPSSDDDGNDTDTITDLVGGNHAILDAAYDDAAAWQADALRGGVRRVDCDGVNRIQANTDVSNLVGLYEDSFTTTIWLRAPSDFSTNDGVMWGHRWTDNGWRIWGKNVSSKLRMTSFWLKDGTNTFSTVVGLDMADLETWVHLAIIWNLRQEKVDIYVNGTLWDTQDITGVLPFVASGVPTWGRYSHNTNSPSKVGWDSARIYRGELGVKQIVELADYRYE
ncbi:unnamed protein product, partial [marine sediment metagenome]